MILLVSTFFIGLGSLVDNAGAKFKSDAKALELIRQARIAIGGDVNINNVRSLTIAGNSMNYFEREGVHQTLPGNLEINLQLPNRFSKMVRIGNPDETNGNVEDRKHVEVIVINKDGEEGIKTGGDVKKNVVIVKDKDGKVLTEDIKPGNGQRKIIIKKDDGTIQEVNPDDKGSVIFERKPGDNTTVWNTKDGKRIMVDKDVKIENVSGERNNEMLHTTLALLLTAPQGLDINYTFAGEENVDGNACNIVEAQTGGSSIKLFLDKSTFLPRMMSFMGTDMPHIVKLDKPSGDTPQKESKVFVRTSEDSATFEHQLKFSDYRSVGDLLLPYRWTESVGGRQTQTTDITNYDVNPTNIAEKFKGEKVFIRKEKP